MDRSSRQKIDKATEILKDTIEKLDLTDILRTIHTKNQNIHFSQVHMEHSQGLTTYWGHRTNLNKFKSTDIITGIFSDHNGMKLEINHRKRSKKKPTTWRLNNMLLKKSMGQ